MAECMTPFTVRDKKTNESIGVPCGKCPACYRRRVSAWSFRLMQEDKVSTNSFMATLTYDTRHVPITKSGYMSLSKRDVQLFMKRLRKLSYKKIKYYAAGEYGDQSLRPHYHVIIFNATQTAVQAAWQLGGVHFIPTTGASVGYTLKYMSKPSKIPLHSNDDRLPEFALMSKGLGASYMTPAMIRWHKSDRYNRMYVPLEDGKKVAMPRYYKERIYNEHERKAIGYEVRKKMLEEKYKSEDADPMYNWNRFQSNNQSFKKMHADYKRGRKI